MDPSFGSFASFVRQKCRLGVTVALPTKPSGAPVYWIIYHSYVVNKFLLHSKMNRSRTAADHNISERNGFRRKTARAGSGKDSFMKDFFVGWYGVRSRRFTSGGRFNLRGLFVLCIAALAPIFAVAQPPPGDQGATNNAAAARQQYFTVVSRGLGRIWRRHAMPVATNQQGQITYYTNSFTELATGLCYWTGTNWVDFFRNHRHHGYGWDCHERSTPGRLCRQYQHVERRRNHHSRWEES